jgi:aminoglycoside phosphotransferase (APT) family kinase protein
VAEVAGLLHNLHRLPPPECVILPRFDRWNTRRLASVPDGEDVRFLRDRCESLQKQYAGLDFALPQGMIHGDAHEGNALRDRNGTVRLLDFEAVAWGPREWDLGVIAMRYQPFGWIAEGDYRAWVAASGDSTSGLPEATRQA